jgi:hypothetical protein
VSDGKKTEGLLDGEMAAPDPTAAETSAAGDPLRDSEEGLPPRADQEPSFGLDSDSLAPAKMPSETSLRVTAVIPQKELWAICIWYAGLVLWTYLVMGEYVVGAELPEFVAWSGFVGILVGGYLHGANRVSPPRMGRIAAGSLVGALGFVALVSTVAGSSRRSEYQSVSTVLLLLGLGALLGGARWARKLRYFGQQRPKLGWVRISLLAIVFGNSLLMLIAFAAQM